MNNIKRKAITARCKYEFVGNSKILLITVREAVKPADKILPLVILREWNAKSWFYTAQKHAFDVRLGKKFTNTISARTIPGKKIVVSNVFRPVTNLTTACQKSRNRKSGQKKIGAVVTTEILLTRQVDFCYSPCYRHYHLPCRASPWKQPD